jgi:hypothetical protein
MIVLVTTAPLSVTTWTSVVIAVVDDVTTVRKVEDGVFGAEEGVVEGGLGVTVTIGESPTTVCVIVMGRPRLVGL